MKVTITITDTPTGVQIMREFSGESEGEELSMAYALGRVMFVPPIEKRKSLFEKVFDGIMAAWGLVAIPYLLFVLWEKL